MVTVRMTSDVFGGEDFHYDDLDQALDGIRRLVHQAEQLDDRIERVIGVVVNADVDSHGHCWDYDDVLFDQMEINAETVEMQRQPQRAKLHRRGAEP
jgi:hypothetical protein